MALRFEKYKTFNFKLLFFSFDIICVIELPRHKYMYRIQDDGEKE